MKLDLKEWINKVTGQAEFKTLLWTNTTSPFNAQTVALSLSSYDHVEVWFGGAGAADAMLPNPLIIPIGEKREIVTIHSLIGAGVNENTGARTATVSTTGVTFSNYAYKNRRSGGTLTTANNFAVPHRIYGVRYVGG